MVGAAVVRRGTRSQLSSYAAVSKTPLRPLSLKENIHGFDGGFPGSPRNRTKYRYDALGRRIEHLDHTQNLTTFYYYDNQSIIAEYTWRGETKYSARQYVNGTQYIDERVVMRDITGEDGQDHYYLLEELYSVAGLAGMVGQLEEMYVYDTYGQATVWAWPLGDVNRDGEIDASDITQVNTWKTAGSPLGDLSEDGVLDYSPDPDEDLAIITANDDETPVQVTYSSLDNPFMFTGRLTDTINDNDELIVDDDETGYRRIQDNRNRSYDPHHGRWFQRDPLGVRPDAPMPDIDFDPPLQYRDGGSLVQYVRSSPTDRSDPAGLISAEKCACLNKNGGGTQEDLHDCCQLQYPPTQNDKANLLYNQCVQDGIIPPCGATCPPPQPPPPPSDPEQPKPPGPPVDPVRWTCACPKDKVTVVSVPWIGGGASTPSLPAGGEWYDCSAPKIQGGPDYMPGPVGSPKPSPPPEITLPIGIGLKCCKPCNGLLLVKKGYSRGHCDVCIYRYTGGKTTVPISVNPGAGCPKCIDKGKPRPKCDANR